MSSALCGVIAIDDVTALCLVIAQVRSFATREQHRSTDFIVAEESGGSRAGEY